MKEALNLMPPLSMNGASRFSMLRSASDTRLATSNIEVALQMCGGLPAARWRSTLITACVAARPPELSSTSTRSAARSNTVILQNLAKLSTPAWVRESLAKIRPSSSFTPTQ